MCQQQLPHACMCLVLRGDVCSPHVLPLMLPLPQPNAEAQFLEVKSAFGVLSDAQERAQYDRKLQVGWLGWCHSQQADKHGYAGVGVARVQPHHHVHARCLGAVPCSLATGARLAALAILAAGAAAAARPAAAAAAALRVAAGRGRSSRKKSFTGW